MATGPSEPKPPPSRQSKDPCGERNPAAEAEACPIVGIGASAGGLEAFTELLQHLPLDTGMGFVLVQHLDPHHESALTHLLARATSLPVREVTDNLRVESDHVYVIPPNTGLAIDKGVLRLEPPPVTRTPLRSIDSFFESLAEDQRERAIGVILSGTATDGTLGLEAIKAEGGLTFAQDGSARYESMPRSAVVAGCVDFILSPKSIAGELARIAKHPNIAGPLPELSTDGKKDLTGTTQHEHETRVEPGGDETSGGGASPQPAEGRAARGKSDNGFKKIELLLRNHSGVDFSHYKSATLLRRITRRLVLNKLDTLENYADFLRGNARELDALYSDVLISVTSFFRNPEAFEFLKSKVFPKFLEQRSDEPVRVWVVGCSSGQEAYSVAMAFTEVSEKAFYMRRLQVFATDLNETLLEKARHGLYAKSLLPDVSPERLRRFFSEEEGGYRVSKALRDMVVFARQNLISDPPFSRMNLICCRNLLIYLESSLQKKALPAFHYALKPEGFLLLGASESIGSFIDLFEPVDKKHRIYSKKPAQARPFQLPVKRTRAEPALAGQLERARAPFATEVGDEGAAQSARDELNVEREADRFLIKQFAPPSVVINAELQILQFRGQTGAYLEPATGIASFEVLKMAREGLMLPLRTAINEAKKDNKTVRRENVRINQDGNSKAVNLKVIPLKNLRERCFLILFEDAETDAPTPASLKAAQPHREESADSPVLSEEPQRFAELQSELADTRDYLESLQEQQQAANEELQADNKEVESANEELQSTNEELETSKEELESANEELTVVNEEMIHRNAELNRLNSDLTNIQTSANLAIVLMGRDLIIRRFSAQAEKQFHLQASDIGRPFVQVRHNLVFEERRQAGGSSTRSDLRQLESGRRQADRQESAGNVPAAAQSPNDLESFIIDVIAKVRERQREVRDNEGRWHSLRVRPYLTLDNRVEGAVLVLMEINDLKSQEQSVVAARDYAEAILHIAPDPLIILNADLRVHRANEAFYRSFNVQPAEAEGRLIYDIGNHQWNVPRLRRLLEDILPRDSSFDHFEVKHDFERIGQRTMLLNARTLRENSHQARILLGIQDITEILQLQSAAQESQNRYQALIEASTQIVWTTDPDGGVVEDSPSWSAFTGQSYEQRKGLGWLDALHPDDRERVSELWQCSIAEHTPVETEYRIRHNSGDWRWMAVRAVPVSNSDGSIHEWVGMNIDITRRKQGEEDRARFAAIVESSDDAIISKDLNGVITSWNKGAERVFGYTAQEAVGKSVTLLIPPERFDEEPSIIERIRRGESIDHYETVRRRKDATLIHVSLTVSPIVDNRGQVVGASKIAHDITDRKKAEESLREEDRRKNEFLAMLAHELRNPLAPIRNALEILRQSGENREAVHSASEMMERQVGQMARLVDDLLDVSRISRGKIELRKGPMELAFVVNQAVDVARPLAEGKGIDLSVSLPAQPLYLDADPIRLAQVVGNLLNNACKFTDKGGRIGLTVELASQGDQSPEEVLIRVRDSGIGIAPNQLGRIFDMFVQLDTSLERSVSGLGIGLTLAKNLVELHGGTMEVHSAGAGQGSEFVVRLPVLAEAPKPAPPEPAAMELKATPPRRILVVDDNEDSAESLTILLSLAGHKTHTAYDGLEALGAAETFRPDMILLDIGLPKLNGYEVARKIRKQPWGQVMVLVALTGWGQEEDRRRSRDAGFNHHLTKPVDPLELTNLLARLSLAQSAN